MTTMTTIQGNEMAALFCAIVVSRKSRKSLPEFLRILNIRPAVKSMALEQWGRPVR